MRKAAPRITSGIGKRIDAMTRLATKSAVGKKRGAAAARVTLVLGALLFLAIADRAARADDPPSDDAAPAEAKVSFYRDIRPIFQANCHGCHQPAKRSGEYVMTDFDHLVAGGESGSAAIIPGKPQSSYLVDQIKPIGDEAAMPKEKQPLSETDIDLIRQWIAQGAENDTPPSTRPTFDADHPPQYNALPVITSLDFSSDGQWLAVSGYHEVLLHHADGSGLAARLVGMSERIESAEFSPDGKFLAVAGGSPGRMGEVQIWNVAEKELVLSLMTGYDTCYGTSWSPDGKLVAYGCPDSTVHAFEVETGKEVLFSGAHDDWVLDTVFSTKGDHLITVSRDMSMKLIEVGTQRFIDNITSITPGALKGGLHAVDRHPQRDELLAGGSDGRARIYKMVRDKARQIGDDFNLIRAFPEMPGRVFDVCYSPDGTRVVAGSSLNGSGQVRIFDEANENNEIAKIDVPHGGIYSVAFSHDGKRIAAGGFDGLVRLYDAESGSPVTEFAPVDIQPESDTVSGGGN